MDMSRPMYWDRLDTPLPDKPYKDVLTEAEKSLKQKEKGPWSELSKEEKIACKLLSPSKEGFLTWEQLLQQTTSDISAFTLFFF